MKIRSRLQHAAAGLLSSLISRNNDVDGFWAPGLLYRDAALAPHIVQVDLLTGASQPASAPARLTAACYATCLRTAVEKLGLSWTDLTCATISFQFNIEVSDPWFHSQCGGDPFVCTVDLATAQHRVSRSARARCLPLDAYLAGARMGSMEEGAAIANAAQPKPACT